MKIQLKKLILENFLDHKRILNNLPTHSQMVNTNNNNIKKNNKERDNKVKGQLFGKEGDLTQGTKDVTNGMINQSKKVAKESLGL